MLITNLPPDRHLNTIVEQMQASRRADLMVSYVRQSGVRALREEIARLCGSGSVRMICSFDMDITEPEAVRELKNIGAEVRIFQAKRGSFHPKVWLFENQNQQWNCLVGSANFTAGGMVDNVEVSVLLENGAIAQQGRKLFGKLWDSKACYKADDELLDKWAAHRQAREYVKRRVAQTVNQSDPGEDIAVLKEFVSGWINTGTDVKTARGAEGVISNLWRGWYVIPDQGEINGEMMGRMSQICQIIKESGGTLDIPSPKAPPSPEGSPFDKILRITTEKLQRPKHKMSPRDLFVRQEKNYLIHLGLADESATGKITLTRHGKSLADARNDADTRRVHTEAMAEHLCNNLNLLEFMRRLLVKTRTLDFTEFSFFACHAWASAEVDTIASLVEIYRRLTKDQRDKFVRDMEEMFDQKLSPTAKNVKGNYKKKVRHTMSALGWCEDFLYDSKERKIRQTDGE